MALGIYLAGWPLLIVIALAFPQWAIYYFGFLLFLGLCLRPLLEHSGAYALYVRVTQAAIDRKDRRFLLNKQLQVDRKARDDKYRHSRYRDPRLPKNW